jgi:hypothetical protein
MSDEELWLQFLELVRRNAEKLGEGVSVDAESHASPYVIGWGSGLFYEFDPARARHQGLAVSVIVAVGRIRASLRTSRTSTPKYRREFWW